MNRSVSTKARAGIGAILLALSLAMPAHAATVSFQGRTYDVTFVVLPVSVPPVSTNDLMFVQAPNGQKLLAIPSDATARGDFDIVDQRFYMLTRTNGQIDSFARINATLVNLDGTFFSTTTQSPDFNLPPLQTFARPLTIPNTESAVDICIVNNELFGYRTDGPQTGLQKVYTITRQVGSSVVEQFPVTLINGDPLNANRSVFLAHDNDTGNYLLSQIALDATPQLNSNLNDRISAYTRLGLLSSELTLDANTVLPTYSGNAVGFTVDRITGDIYLLDGSSRQIFIFKPQEPSISSLGPLSGGAAGGTSVVINGLNLPADAAVFFGGTAATITEIKANLIRVTTPAHALGTVDVTVTGTGIPTAEPLRLVSAFTFVNTRPAAVLTASSSAGPKPLTVLFDLTGTGDTDGSLTALKLDLGDGLVLTLPPDLSTLTVTHTYSTDGTFIARLTATDDMDDIGIATAVIVVGTGGDDLRLDLFLKSMSFTVKGPTKDTVTVKGNFTLPEASDLAKAVIILGFIHPITGSLVNPPSSVNNNAPFANANKGGEFVITLGELDSRFKVKSPVLNFAIKPLKSRFLPANTQTFSLVAKKQDVRDAVENAFVNLIKNETGALLTDLLTPAQLKEKRVGKVLLLFQMRLASGRVLTYAKAAVVNISSKTTTSIKLVRQ